ncbi:MAG: YraN family protein [Phycisphaerae bacterium]
MSGETKRLGAAGEKAAARYLKRAGYKILTRNYICAAGEIDIICFRDSVIVFVEVKTRRTSADADPEVNVHAHKQKKLVQVARSWLAAHREPECAYRFDAVSVILPDQGKPVIRHIVEAFVPSGW